MGTILYSTLVELLLEEGDKTREEIIKESYERFGFRGEKANLELNFQLMLKEASENIAQIEDEKYHLLKPSEDKYLFLDFFKNTPESYFKKNPNINKLKKALEKTAIQD
jgi:hypothetical protein